MVKGRYEDMVVIDETDGSSEENAEDFEGFRDDESVESSDD